MASPHEKQSSVKPASAMAKRAPLHPRRPPAHRSVSLLHHATRSRPAPTQRPSGGSSSSDSGIQQTSRHGSGTDSPSSLQPLAGRNSSGESSNAENWFEKSNNDVRDNSTSFADNDPPFFMRNSSSSETPPDRRQGAANVLNRADIANSLPLRTDLLRLGTDVSSTEDFRGVIDDLTIENKKLKRRLKKYEKLHDSHLKDEKLFEVRIHGLPTEKKKELEETLRKFASSLSTSGANAFPPNGYASLLPFLNTSKTASSQTSFQNADSAYASMSASGPASSAQSGERAKGRPTPRQHLASRQQNVQSYLHHIPEGLMPQQNPANMSERAKKKLVVRRLEQLFAGKVAIGEHQQPLQQQEVSHSAARADQAETAAAGRPARKEGAREAFIMDMKKSDAMEGWQNNNDASNTNAQMDQPQDRSWRSPAEQRPTRPLDLDPCRAQVPADNLEYMRHLGFSPPVLERVESPEEGHGWIYLNFLINMAQLHTVHVTPEYVRKALLEYSKKFEISEDGRKVRWKGRRTVTRTSSNGGGGSSNDRTSESTPDERNPNKRPKLMHRTSSSNKAGGTTVRSRGRHSYTPLFFHKDESSDSENSSSEEEDSMSSPYRLPIAGDSSGMTSSGMHTSSGLRTTSTKRKAKRDDGPIIFYNNAQFCTDLSGERKILEHQNTPPYTTASSIPLGTTRVVEHVYYEKRGPLASTADLPEPMDLSDNPIPQHMELAFPPRSPPDNPGSKSLQQAVTSPVNLEVTGIGGVWPADHFAISVDSCNAHVEQQEEVVALIHAAMASKTLPPRFAKIFHGTTRRPSLPTAIQNKVVAARVQRLPPSELPPALGFMQGDDSGDEDDGDADDAMSLVPDSPGAFPPSAAPQPVELPYTSSDDDEDEDDDDEDDESAQSDGTEDDSVDFLAAARQIDPDAVREQEREYDANMAERLAEEIPAGSSAATAGGGSGFASPASGVPGDEYQRAIREARRNARPVVGRKRAAKEPVAVPVKAESVSSEEEEEEEEEMSDIRS